MYTSTLNTMNIKSLLLKIVYTIIRTITDLKSNNTIITQLYYIRAKCINVNIIHNDINKMFLNYVNLFS